MIKKLFLVLALSFSTAVGIFAQDTATTAPAAKADEPAKKPTFRSTKDQVKEAQTLLKSKKMYDGEATGTSSNEWKAAVKAYQGANGLTKTGSLNRATLEKMNIKLTDKQKDIPVDPKHIASSEEKPKKSNKKSDTTDVKTDAKTNSTGLKRPAPFQATAEQITTIQTKLKEAKMFSGDADGKRSDELKAAVKKYQETNGLKATGGINAETLEKMGIALTDKQKEQVAAQAAYDAAKKKE